MYHKQEKCLDTWFLRLMFLLRGLFLSLLQQSLFKILFNVKRVSLGCIVVGSSFIKKKGKSVKMTTRCHSLSLVVICCHSLSFVVTRCHLLSLVVIPCHSLSFVVTRCLLLYHLLSLVAPLVVIRCHSLYHSSSLVVTRCITRLSFYKRSFLI